MGRPSRLLPDGRKQCAKCLQPLPLEAFHPCKNVKDGYRSHCKECCNADNRARHHRQLEKESERGKRYWAANREKGCQKHADYYQRNKPAIYARITRRRHADPNVRLYEVLRGRLQKLITKKRRTFVYLGCHIDTFRRYIEGLWQPGMSWSNYGAYRRGGKRTWHIDHIRPCSTFNLTQDEECFRCFNWLNCQPMWAVDNMSKGAYEGWLDGFDPGI